MSRNVRVLQCTPEDVFRVLADGWLYPCWVVGASRMRKVEDTWPQEEAIAGPARFVPDRSPRRVPLASERPGS